MYHLSGGGGHGYKYVAVWHNTHMIGNSGIYEKKRDALKKEILRLDVCDMEWFGKLESSDKTIATEEDG